MSSKLMIASIVFYSLHIVGMLWTDDLKWGFHILHKMWYFLLLFPVLFSIVQKKHINHYITAFLLAIALTEIISYLVWFEIIQPFKNATVLNPTPFMSHISYNPILAFAIYLVYHDILFKINLSGFKFFLYSFFATTMTINMFITGGRAGQVAYFLVLGISILQLFNKQKMKSLFAVVVLIPTIFFGAYQTSDIFHNRVNAAFNEALVFTGEEVRQRHQTSSVGLRITFALNSWDVIKKNPIIGVGTGDFPSEYKKINQINTPNLVNQAYVTNPHNMYILVMMELGLIGLVSMLSIFYYQIKLSFSASSRFLRDVGLTLPLIFLVLMLSDSYILGHYTTLMYVFFSAFLHKDFEKS